MNPHENELKERELEEIRTFRTQQQKFRYYIIALSVASIGFTITKTFDQSLKLSQVPLLFAVLAWATSIYLGLKHLKGIIGSIYTEVQRISILRGNNYLTGNNPRKIKLANNELVQSQRSDSDKLKTIGNWSDKTFYIGVLLFLIWHILEMFLRTSLK